MHGGERWVRRFRDGADEADDGGTQPHVPNNFQAMSAEEQQRLVENVHRQIRGRAFQAALQRQGWATIHIPELSAHRQELLQRFEADTDTRTLAEKKYYGTHGEVLPRVVDMERVEKDHNKTPGSYGKGVYCYLKEPLPGPLQLLRETIYEALQPLANADLPRHVHEIERGRKSFASDVTAFPATLAEMQTVCKDHWQEKSTCLVLQYNAGGFNAPHRDIYGAVSFPLQALTMLSVPGEDFGGGHFFLQASRTATNQRQYPQLGPGDVVIFQSSRWHGSEQVAWGRRVGVGLQFHWAER